MNNSTGLLITLEGVDASGKTTQAAILKGRLEQAGYKVMTFDFPQNNQTSSYFAKKYLHGDYGNFQTVGPYSTSLFFALDRFEAAPKIKEALAKGYIVIANRFTASNMAYQSTIFSNTEQRRGFYIWLDNLEFMLLGIPRPDLNIYLRTNPALSSALMDIRLSQDPDYFTDINEKNTNIQLQAQRSYEELCQLFPKDFKQIDCVRSGALMSIENIHKMIWESVQPLLPEVSNNIDAVSFITEMTEKSEQVTRPKLTETIPNKIYVSQLLASKLGFTHLTDPTINTLENRYYIPNTLDEKLRFRYIEVMDSLFEIYDEMKHRINPEHIHLLSAVLPLAKTKSYVIGHDEYKKINSSPSIEANSLVKDLSLDQDLVTKKKLNSLSKETGALLANNFDIPSDHTVTLLSANPRNELDVVANILYPTANIPMRDLKTKIETWSYDQKESILLAYLEAKNDEYEDLGNINYCFEINAPFIVLKDLQTAAPNASFVWQNLTPRYGYDIPEEIEAAGLADIYERCFDISLELYSELQAAGYNEEKEYVILQGHIARFKLRVDYQQIKSIISFYEANQLLTQTVIEIMIDNLKQTHPLLYNRI